MLFHYTRAISIILITLSTYHFIIYYLFILYKIIKILIINTININENIFITTFSIVSFQVKCASVFYCNTKLPKSEREISLTEVSFSLEIYKFDIRVTLVNNLHRSLHCCVFPYHFSKLHHSLTPYIDKTKI